MKRCIAALMLALAGPSAAFAQAGCPTVTLDGPIKPAPAGRPIVFKAKAAPLGPYGYSWSLSNGTITSGQYTPTISVKAPPASSVTATLEVVGLPKACGTTWSISAATGAAARRAPGKKKP
jgi:hypothetical protein